VAKSIVKSDILLAAEPRASWLKSILKSGILFSRRPPWLKSIAKFDMLFGHRPSWLKRIVGNLTYFLATDRRG
jgi:hypothetical protein